MRRRRPGLRLSGDTVSDSSFDEVGVLEERAFAHSCQDSMYLSRLISIYPS